MSDSRNYYHTSRSADQNDMSLPPIREVVGAELDRRTRPDPYAFGDVRSALAHARASGGQGQAHNVHSSSSDQRGPTLPPIQQSGYTSSRGTTYPAPSRTLGRYPSEHVSASQPQRGHSTDYRAEGSNHSYAVLRTSGTGHSLVDARPPAPRPQGILRQTAAPVQSYDDDPDKKHKCEYCGKKFDRPSSLNVHLRTHTGSQPFACEWPGCERTFSVRSNMLRHYRSHEKAGNIQYQYKGLPPGGDLEDEREERDDPSSSYFRTPSSSGQPHYYSSSRRK